MNRALLSGLVMCVATSTMYAQSADRCSDVLRSGVFNENKSFTQANYTSKLKDALCAESSTSNQDSNAVGASAKVGIFGGEGSYNEQHAQSLKDSYCHKQGSNLSQDDVNWMMQRIASEAVLKAWSRCMELHAPKKGVVVGEIDDVNGDNFIFSAHWNPALGVVDATATSFVVKGASCDPVLIKAGTKIDVEGIKQPCIRSGSGTVTVVLNTNHGAAVGNLNGIKPVVTTPVIAEGHNSLKNKCLGGYAPACQTLAEKLAPRCQPKFP